MKLREISKQIREEDRPDPSFSLQGEQEISALNEGLLVDFPETIFIANSQSYIFGKVQKSTLLYLIGRQRQFRFQQVLVTARNRSASLWWTKPAGFFTRTRPTSPFWGCRCGGSWESRFRTWSRASLLAAGPSGSGFP